MRIAASDVTLWAASERRVETRREESLVVWVGQRPQEARGETGQGASTTPARPPLADTAPPNGNPADLTAPPPTPCENHHDRALLDLLMLLKSFGDSNAEECVRRIKDGQQRLQNSQTETESSPSSKTAPPTEGADDTGEGWGLEYDLLIERKTSEDTQFAASARVVTQDGRTIDAQLAMRLQRETMERLEMNVRAGDAKPIDPLVLNQPGTFLPAFAGTHQFDLDADGQLDEIARLTSGHYLALDKNNNGQIDDGSELFGPQSGNGFADLAQHDDDGNGWIDEADTVFDRIMLWRPPDTSNAPHELISLRAADVGAIYLGNMATPFSIAQGMNTQGQLQATGIYLTEDGQAGTVQHVDLFVA